MKKKLNKKYGYISQYASLIDNGSIVVSEYIRKIYKRITDDLDSKKYYFNNKKAEMCVAFIENFCHHTKGYDGYLILELWQKALISCIFGLVDKNGLRVYREIVVIIARKNGKSLLASAIIACAAYIDGENGAEIYCLAPKLKQANIVFNDFYKSVQKEPDLMKISKKTRDGVEIKINGSDTIVSTLAFNSKSSDGFNPHLAVHDEISSWRGERGKKQYEVMKSALGSRKQPFILNISTSGYEDNGVYDDLIKRSTAFLNGNSDELRLLPFLYMIDDVENWDKIDELKKSNPNLNISVHESFYVEEIKIARQSRSKKAEYMTKYCNIKQSNSYAWLEYELVDRCCINLQISELNDTYAVAGIDLSQTTDLTAVSIVIEKHKQLYCFTRFFMPTNKLAEATERDNMPYQAYVDEGVLQLSGESYVNYKDIVEYLEFIKDEYGIYILKVGYDRYSAQYLIDDLEERGYQCDDVKQGENLSPVIDEFEGILKDGDFYICDNNLLKAHFLNLAVQENTSTRQRKLIKIQAIDRIDGAISAMCGITVRQKWYKEIGELLKNDD